jgi:lipopolysaccharide transport system ATP-binding protein
VSFDVKQGERVGIIGRNGAGKSTLLKILSRITEPTTGRVSIKGRVASLLEVGTGFHPELTGRENIYLNGAILGMSKAEIRKNFDAIVDFAGVEQFLDTPVKHYSSGMYVRLAFAVAAHLDTEILLIDEVLAVGDAEFQKKCMGKMDEISHKEGRTILFVSHNMGAIEQLCDRVICLAKGILVADTQDVSRGVKQYLHDIDNSTMLTEWENPGALFQNPWFQPLKFGLYDNAGLPVSQVLTRNEKIQIIIEGIVKVTNSSLCVGYALYTEDGMLLYWSYHTDQMNTQSELNPLSGNISLSSILPLTLLNNGIYLIELLSSLHNTEWLTHPNVNAPKIFFNLEGAPSASPYWLQKRPGLIAPALLWKMQE